MEANLCVRRTVDVYSQEEQSFWNILSAIGSLGTERLHFRSIPAEPVNFRVRTASCPAAVLVTGIPWMGRGSLCDVTAGPPTGHGIAMTINQINRPKTRRYGATYTFVAVTQAELMARFVV